MKERKTDAQVGERVRALAELVECGHSGAGRRRNRHLYGPALARHFGWVRARAAPRRLPGAVPGSAGVVAMEEPEARYDTAGYDTAGYPIAGRTIRVGCQHLRLRTGQL